MRATIVITVATALALSGCIAVPVSHEMWISPKLSGIVRDIDTLEPIEGATVKITGQVPGRQAELMFTTGPDGKYAGVVVSKERYYYLFLGPADSECQFTVDVSRAGYLPKQTTRSRFGIGSGAGPCAKWVESIDIELERVASNTSLERGREG